MPAVQQKFILEKTYRRLAISVLLKKLFSPVYSIQRSLRVSGNGKMSLPSKRILSVNITIETDGWRFLLMANTVWAMWPVEAPQFVPWTI